VQVAGCDGRKEGSFESRVCRKECSLFRFVLRIVFCADK